MPFDRIQLSRETLRAAVGDDWSAAEVDAAAELLASSDGKFPSGARRLPSDLVAAVQRERLIAAMLKAASELGYRQATVQDVIDRAGVSRPTFYEHFANKEACFLTAFDATAARLQERIELAAARGGDNWRDRLRLSLEELLSFAGTEPDAARALIVEARAASADALQRRDEMLEGFGGCLEELAREHLPDSSHSQLTAAGVIGGIEALLYSRLNKGDLQNLRALLPSLMYFAVLSYEGHEAAGEELAMTVP